MHTIKKDKKLALSKYARDNNLLNTPKWKWSRLLSNNLRKFIKMSNIFSAQTKRHNIKYNYGVKVPKNVK